MATAGPLEREGVVRDEKTGEYFIPATQRPDGTWRKPRKVKDGYVPQEEVPTYENRGVQWMKSKPSLPPGLNPEEVAPKETSHAEVDPMAGMSKAAKKNAKRKEKKKQQKEQSGTIDSVSKSLADTKLSSDQSETTSQSSGQSGKPPQEKDIEKVLRNLKKKLRQIEDLENKIKSGEIKEPAKEQLEKVAKKKAILEEIEDLELDLMCR